MRAVRDLIFRLDDLRGAATRALVTQHLAEAHASTPAESVHALGIDELQRPDVTFWSAWMGDGIAGCGALKDLGAGRGEIKSMRVADPFRGRGVGRAVLEHLVAEARARGLTSLWLETGSSAQFAPARRLYEGAGFRWCAPFDAYVEDPLSVFMTREV
jgi:putative acetyltransferase